jgi:hypothetical protein
MRATLFVALGLLVPLLLPVHAVAATSGSAYDSHDSPSSQLDLQQLRVTHDARQGTLRLTVRFYEPVSAASFSDHTVLVDVSGDESPDYGMCRNQNGTDYAAIGFKSSGDALYAEAGFFPGGDYAYRSYETESASLSADGREVSATLSDPSLARVTYRCAFAFSWNEQTEDSEDQLDAFYLGVDEPPPGQDHRTLSELPACSTLSPSTPQLAFPSVPSRMIVGRAARAWLPVDSPAKAVAHITGSGNAIRLDSAHPDDLGNWTILANAATAGRFTVTWEELIPYQYSGDPAPKRQQRCTFADAEPIRAVTGVAPRVIVPPVGRALVRIRLQRPRNCSARAATGPIRYTFIDRRRHHVLTLPDQCGDWPFSSRDHVSLGSWRLSPSDSILSADPPTVNIAVSGAGGRWHTLRFRAVWQGHVLMQGTIKGRLKRGRTLRIYDGTRAFDDYCLHSGEAGPIRRDSHGRLYCTKGGRVSREYQVKTR